MPILPRNDKELTEAFAKIGLPPKFSEAKLFFMALAFLLLLSTNPSVWQEISQYIYHESPKVKATSITMFIYSLLGIGLAFYNAFSIQPKSKGTKEILLTFAMTITLFSGISVGLYAVEHSQGYLLVIPILNIIYTVLTFFSMGHQMHIILDKNSRLWELFIGSVIVAGIFYVLQYSYHAYWSITFTTCIAYAMLVHDGLSRLFIYET